MRRSPTLFIGLLILVICLFGASDIVAQCPMCRMSAESNMANGGTAGNGLNAGILYMLATPYLLVGTFVFLWWRNKKKSEQQLEDK
ncbi:MAG: hypothetical protein K9I85_05950 [Saprospiraceae bacterium]|nr:hypothetical protein [Saprospiraceae bacterium]